MSDTGSDSDQSNELEHIFDESAEAVHYTLDPDTIPDERHDMTDNTTDDSDSDSDRSAGSSCTYPLTTASPSIK